MSKYCFHTVLFICYSFKREFVKYNIAIYVVQLCLNQAFAFHCVLDSDFLETHEAVRSKLKTHNASVDRNIVCISANGMRLPSLWFWRSTTEKNANLLF